MQNKPYIILYLTSVGISITNIIQTGLALSTGLFIELNPIGFNWVIIFLMILSYLFLLVPILIKTILYKRVFLIGIICFIVIGILVFIHDFIIIRGIKI